MGTIHENTGVLRLKVSKVGTVDRPVGAGLLTALVDLVLSWVDLAQQRRALQSLDDRLLKDIGLTRANVESESSKPFWQL